MSLVFNQSGGDAEDRYQIACILYEIEPEERHDAREARLRRAARALICRHRADIECVADALAEREALTGEKIDAMLPPGFMARPDAWNDFTALPLDSGDGRAAS